MHIVIPDWLRDPPGGETPGRSLSGVTPRWGTVPLEWLG